MNDHLTDRPIPAGRHILFIDIDGTIIDSFPGIRAGFLHALDTVGVAHPDEDFIARIPGPPMEHTLASLGLSAPTVREAFDAYMAYTRDGGWADATVFTGMAEFLQEARAAGYWLATASSKGEGFARRILQRVGLLEELDFLGAAEEYGTRRTKDAVINYVLTANDLVGREQDILMLGDRAHDIEGARVFGIDTVAVEWGYGDVEEWNTARFRAGDTTNLKEIVRDWTNNG